MRVVSPTAATYERVTRWFDEETVPCLHPDQLADDQLVLEFTHA